jgi:hypothetical protein
MSRRWPILRRIFLRRILLRLVVIIFVVGTQLYYDYHNPNETETGIYGEPGRARTSNLLFIIGCGMFILVTLLLKLEHYQQSWTTAGNPTTAVTDGPDCTAELHIDSSDQYTTQSSAEPSCTANSPRTTASTSEPRFQSAAKTVGISQRAKQQPTATGTTTPQGRGWQ